MRINVTNLKVGLLSCKNVPEVGRISAEGNLKMLQEFVHASQERLRSASFGVDTRSSIEDNDTVSQICGHDEIVLHNESSLFGMQNEPLDHLKHCGKTLTPDEFRIRVFMCN